VAGAAGIAPPASARPQPPQNFSVASFSNPHAAQARGSGAPQWAQKRRPGRLPPPQLEQCRFAIVAALVPGRRE
jgi:hypothetical protein